MYSKSGLVMKKVAVIYSCVLSQEKEANNYLNVLSHLSLTERLTLVVLQTSWTILSINILKIFVRLISRLTSKSFN